MFESSPRLVSVPTTYVLLNDVPTTAYPSFESLLGQGHDVIHDCYVDISQGTRRRRFLIGYRACFGENVNIALERCYSEIRAYGELIVMRVGEQQVFVDIKNGMDLLLAKQAVRVYVI